MPQCDLAKITRESAGMRLVRGAACAAFHFSDAGGSDGARGQSTKRALKDDRSSMKTRRFK